MQLNISFYDRCNGCTRNELCFNFDINHDVDLTISPFCPHEEAERKIQFNYQLTIAQL